MAGPIRRGSARASAPSHRAIKRAAFRQLELGRLAMETGQRASLVLLAVLAQSGGSITVTDTTLEETGATLDRLDYSIEDGPEPHTSIIKLVTKD